MVSSHYLLWVSQNNQLLFAVILQKVALFVVIYCHNRWHYLVDTRFMWWYIYTRSRYLWWFHFRPRPHDSIRHRLKTTHILEFGLPSLRLETVCEKRCLNNVCSSNKLSFRNFSIVCTGQRQNIKVHSRFKKRFGNALFISPFPNKRKENFKGLGGALVSVFLFAISLINLHKSPKSID